MKKAKKDEKMGMKKMMAHKKKAKKDEKMGMDAKLGGVSKMPIKGMSLKKSSPLKRPSSPGKIMGEGGTGGLPGIEGFNAR